MHISTEVIPPAAGFRESDYAKLSELAASLSDDGDSFDLGDGAFADLSASGAWIVSDEDAAVELSTAAVRRLAIAAGVLAERWDLAATPAVPEGYVGGAQRVVHSDGTITFGGTRYDLPLELAGQRVLVFHRPDRSAIYVTNQAGTVRYA